MDNGNLHSFLSSTNLGKNRDLSAREADDLAQFLVQELSAPAGVEFQGKVDGLTRVAPSISPSPHVPQTTQLSQFLPALLSIVTQIKQELEQNVAKLLSLNPSRREAVAQHLERLANLPAGPSLAQGASDAAAGLRRWVEGPRTPAQNQALQTYFEEVAMVALGQIFLLKAWSDRGIRPLCEEDLGKLGWVLFNTLKQHVPLDREGWLITRANLYSWYNPGANIQREIWRALEHWRVSDEGPSLLSSMLKLARRKLSAGSDFASYDERFFSLLWQNLSRFGFDLSRQPGPVKRKRVAFSPTLRDGAVVRTGPVSLTWLGLEAHPFRLIAAELTQLWWGPAPPPCWNQGSGLEVHSRDQLQLQLNSPKPSLNTRIAEMEACDLSFVLEEKIVRTSSRSADGAKLREQLETLPYFKKLKSTQTSLGALQACVALSKLRPGGLLWWAREEALAPSEGSEMLRYLLDQGKLICEWRLDGVEHSLPGSTTPFPKFLYLFERDTALVTRLSHRPIRVTARGQVRSHVEVPMLLSDAFQLGVLPGETREGNRGQWQIHSLQSPTSQKEWAERWPEPTEPGALGKLDRLRTDSLPLASLTTLRLTPQGDPKKNHAWSMHASVNLAIRGFWMRAELDAQGARKLVTHLLPTAPAQANGQGLMVIVPDEAWIAPLRHYLESSWTAEWLEHHCERKGENWVLHEQTARLIPIPKALAEALGPAPEESPFALPLPGDWERLASELVHHPRKILSRLGTLGQDAEARRVRGVLFVRIARAMEHIESTHRKLLSLVRPDGQIVWRELLQILPVSEHLSVALHPELRLSGVLPPHLPIARISKVKSPLPGILLSTDAGLALHISSEQPRLLDMLADQLEGAENSTWAEVMDHVILPRSFEFASATAEDVLKSYGDQTARLQALREALFGCLEF